MRDFKRFMVWGGCTAALAIATLTGCQSTMWGKKDERSEGQRANDNRITSQVKERLAQEPVYKFNGVDVKTFDGVVQLSGFVNNDQQKSIAAQVAQQVSGVTRVENAITLKPNDPATPTGRTYHAPVVGFGNQDPSMTGNGNNAGNESPGQNPNNQNNANPSSSQNQNPSNPSQNQNQ